MTLADKKAELSAVLAANVKFPTLGSQAWFNEYIVALREDIAAMEAIEKAAEQIPAAADRARDSPPTSKNFDWQPVIRLAMVVWPIVKKHFPAASAGAALSAAVSWLFNFLKQ